MFYNIKHGGQGENLFMYTIGLNKKLFSPEAMSDTIELDDNTYILLPVYVDKKHKQDSKGNYLYFISIDHMDNHKEDYIILWEIPNKLYTEVTYTINGDASELGSGISGRSRGSTNYTSPSPVLEIYGECELCWTGVNANGIKHKQIISFKNGDWNIGAIKTIEEEE